MEVKKYRFTASTSTLEREVFPKNGNTLVISWEKEKERALFSKKLKGKMLFDGDDFHWFYDIEKSATRCTPVDLLIEKKCDSGYEVFFNARIKITKGDFDLDQCILNIETDNNDKYVCYEDEGDEEHNILDGVDSNVTANILVGTLEEVICEGDQDDTMGFDLYWCGTGTAAEHGYVIKSFEKTDVVGANFNFRALYVREKIAGVDLPSPWINIGGGFYAKPPVLYNYQEVGITTGEYRYYYDTGGTIDNGMLLKDVMEYLLSQTCDELTLKSNFFQWNADIVTTTNYVTEELSNVLRLALFQKSDVKRPNGSGNATQALISFSKLLSDVCNIFNLKWDITDGGFLIIEHVSFFFKTTGLNLTDRYDYKLRLGTRRYSYDVDNLYRREVFTMMDDGKFVGGFRGVPIKYNNDCIGKEDKNVIVENIMTNVAYALSNPSPDNSPVSDEGFVLMALDEDNAIISKTLILGEDYLNNSLSWPHLHVDYWRHEKLFQTFEMNNVETEALSVLPIKKQVKINATICCGDEFDPEKKIQTTLGVGQVSTANYGLYSENLDLVLLYDGNQGHVMPVANNDSFSTAKNVVLNDENILENDTGSDITCVPETKDTTHGVVQIFPDGTFIYTPDTDYVGEDSFTYTIIDDLGFTDEGTVTITVTEVVMPNAVNDSYSTTMNIVLNGTGLMLNDTGVPTLECLPETKATTHGNVQIFANGTFTYTPNTSYVGSDSFTYTLIDGNTNTDTATVTITVFTVVMPIAVNDSYICEMNTTLTQYGLMNNDTGVAPKTCLPETKATTHGNVEIFADGHIVYTPDSGYKGFDTFDYTLIDGNSNTDTATVTIEVYEDMGGATAVDDTFSGYKNLGKTGNLIANDTGSGTLGCVYEVKGTTNGGLVQINTNGTFSFSPAFNVLGNYVFTYTLVDLLGATDTATVTITVIDSTPALAVDDAFSSVKNMTESANVLVNDSGTGTLTCTPETKATSMGGAVQIFANGNIIYSPDFNFLGNDTFTYTMQDSIGQSDSATVTVTVIEPPAINAVDDAFSTPINTTLNVGNVLTNDTGTGKVAVAETKATTHGNVQIFANGTFSYVPTTNYYGADAFTYTLEDEYGQTDTATVTITIVPPTINAVDDTFIMVKDTTLNVGNVLANDTASVKTALAETKATTHGNVQIFANGTFTYTPNTSYVGTDTFDYTLQSQYGQTDIGTVTVTINEPDGELTYYPVGVTSFGDGSSATACALSFDDPIIYTTNSSGVLNVGDIVYIDAGIDGYLPLSRTGDQYISYMEGSTRVWITWDRTVSYAVYSKGNC